MRYGNEIILYLINVPKRKPRAGQYFQDFHRINFIDQWQTHTAKTTEPEEVRRGSKQAYCSLPSEKRFHPHIAVMLQKLIPGCQTGQNAISVQSVREITLAEASATVPRDCSSPSARERRVNAFPTSLISEQRRATSGHAI